MSKAEFIRLTQAGVSRVLDGRAGMVFPVLEWVGVDSRCAQAIDFRYPRNDSAYPFQTWTIGPDGFERLNLEAPLTPDPLRRFAFEIYESRGDVSALLELLDAWAGDETLGPIQRQAESQ